LKNIIKYLLGIMLLVLLCTSCQSKELPDTYVEGSDYQYMQMDKNAGQQGDVYPAWELYLFH